MKHFTPAKKKHVATPVPTPIFSFPDVLRCSMRKVQLVKHIIFKPSAYSPPSSTPKSKFTSKFPSSSKFAQSKSISHSMKQVAKPVPSNSSDSEATQDTITK